MFTTSRLNYINYTYPYELGVITFSSPMPMIIHFNNLLQPFDTYIWALIIFTMLIFIALLFITNINIKIKYVLYWDIIVIFLLQKMSKHSMAYPNSVILFTWILMSMIFLKSYCGCIYSIITLPNEHRIETLSDLLESQKSGQIQVVVENDSVFQYVLVCNHLII